MPDLKEKLVELLDTARNKYYGYEAAKDHRMRTAKTEAEFDAEASTYEIRHSFYARELIAHGVTVQEWISVKDRLPEGECLAVSMQKGHSYKEMLVGYVYADAYSDTLYTAESDGEVLRNVTHWMPLPQPPKGE